MLARTCRVALVAALTAGLAVPVALAAGPATAATEAASGKVVNAYFASWNIYGRGYLVKDIPAEKLTHITYAFAKPDENGDCVAADAWADYQKPFTAQETVNGEADTWVQPLAGNFNQLRQLKQEHPHLKVSLALGGWSLSTWFSDVAKKRQTREKFVQSCIDQFIKGDIAGLAPGAAAGVFDGIDIDWEYPGVDAGNGAHFHPKRDKHNATQLMREFRDQLDEAGDEDGRHYELTAALPASDNASKYFELKKVARELDFVNVMTYDFHGAWDPYTGINSPMATDPADPNPGGNPTRSTLGTIQHYLDADVPAEKLVLGTAFYGKQYIRTGTADNGLYQTFDNTGLTGEVLTLDGSTTPTFNEMVKAGAVSSDGSAAGGGWVRHWDAANQAPYLFNPAYARILADGTEVTAPTFISYDDPESLALRVDAVEDMGLGGVMIWEISQDSDDDSLIDAFAPLLD